jgi:hypothetical protein
MSEQKLEDLLEVNRTHNWEQIFTKLNESCVTNTIQKSLALVFALVLKSDDLEFIRPRILDILATHNKVNVMREFEAELRIVDWVDKNSWCLDNYYGSIPLKNLASWIFASPEVLETVLESYQLSDDLVRELLNCATIAKSQDNYPLMDVPRMLMIAFAYGYTCSLADAQEICAEYPSVLENARRSLHQAEMTPEAPSTR